MNRATRQALSLLRKASRAGTLPKMLIAVDQACALMAPRRKAPPKELPKQIQSTKPVRVAAHRMSTKEIRAAVMERAHGRCEACGALIVVWRLVMDHFLGGSGRRRQRQTVETCWALCEGPLGQGCNGERTRNEPSAAHWNDLFRFHCERHGYPVLQHVEHKQLSRGTA